MDDEQRQVEKTETTTRRSTPIERDRKVSKVAQVVWFVTGVIISLLLLRVVLALVGANLANQFAAFIYSVTEPFVAPFRGLLQIGEFQAGIARFEIETLVAALIYTLLGWGIVAGIRLAKKY